MYYFYLIEKYHYCCNDIFNIFLEIDILKIVHI